MRLVAALGVVAAFGLACAGQPDKTATPPPPSAEHLPEEAKAYSDADAQSEMLAAQPPTTLTGRQSRPEVPSMMVLGGKKEPWEVCGFDTCDLKDE